MSDGDDIKRPRAAGRELRVRQAVTAMRARLRAALVGQNGDSVRDVREEHARNEALNAALHLMSAIGQPVRAPRGPHRFATPAAAVSPAVGTELVEVSLTPREVANVRAALAARQGAIGQSAGPEVELDVAAMARVESKVTAAGVRRSVTVTPLPRQRATPASKGSLTHIEEVESLRWPLGAVPTLAAAADADAS